MGLNRFVYWNSRPAELADEISLCIHFLVHTGAYLCSNHPHIFMVRALFQTLTNYWRAYPSTNGTDGKLPLLHNSKLIFASARGVPGW